MLPGVTSAIDLGVPAKFVEKDLEDALGEVLEG